MTEKIKKENKKFVFITSPVCGCETLANTQELENRCDVCKNYFEWGFQTHAGDQ